MVTVRRWYVFLVCAVSLQSVTWAVIALLRNLFISGRGAPVTAIAFQIAVIVIGLPVFLVHWLWAQRLAGQDTDERESALRRLYLYGTLAAFLGPIAANTFGLIATLLGLAFGGRRTDFGFFEFSPTEFIIRDLVAIAVLALLWFYHQRVTAADAKAAPETGNSATVRRLYVLSFSAAGVTMTTMAIVHLLRWIMFQFGGGAAIGGSDIVGLTDEAARLIVGVPLWLTFWRWTQQLFAGPSEEERESALRKFYLYVVVIIAALTTVTNATFILAGVFRRLLSLPPQGDIRDPLPIIIGMGVLWAYHAYSLRGDATLAGEAPRQAGVRRLYLYLIAAVGLAAFLVGLSGDVSVLIRSSSERFFGDDLKEQLAWFTAALIAGLPVWLWPWRQAQAGAVAAGAAGADERRSVVRKIYLYFYLFVATMTVLSSAVYIVYRILSIVLGARSSGNLLSDLGQAIAFSIIAIGVWLYHGYALRGDGQINKREQTQRLSAMRVAVVDAGDGRFGRAVLDGLRRELPGLSLDPIGLTPAAAETMGMDSAIGNQPLAITNHLADAGLIVGLWNIAIAGGASGAVTAEVAGVIVSSPARKLLVPMRTDGWEWAGVDRWNAEAIVRQTVRAVKQMAEGEEVKPVRPLGAGAIIGIIIGVIVLLILSAIPVLIFFSGGFF
ncbi:MAG TPA: DUF5671 domain-containing protein [Anaerolineales bacterium]|nr:DUF5671 domain-containing protein [Anaerolineales bacterium]